MLELEQAETKAPVVLARTAVLIFVLCFGVRLIDVFVIRSDEWFGEQVVTKVLGLAMVVAYAVRSGYGLDRVGFRKAALKSVVWIGIGLTAFVMAATFFVQSLYLQSQQASAVFSVVMEGRSLLAFTSVLTFNLLNATMEESLFRGLLLTHLASIMSRMRANLVQSVLFGLWHIVWPLRAVWDTEMTPAAGLTFAAGYILVATIMGFVWGCFFIWFRSLWVSIFAHAFHNAALGVFHITTAAGASSLAFFTTLEAFVFVALLPVVHWLSKRWQK